MARGQNLFNFGQYTFASWARKGVGNRLEAGGSALVRARLPLTIAINNEAITQDVALLGPADIAGIAQNAIVRTSPLDRNFDFEWNMLPYVEFYDEDFLWRYTPDAPENGNLRPWLALAVLKTEEFTELTSVRGALSAIRLQTSALPPSADCHLWAHMHTGEHAGITSPLSEAVTQQINENVKFDPDGFTCRLLSPRRLEPKTLYHAFLIPAYESGRLAGLGEDFSKILARQAAWPDTNRPLTLDFPVYHRWSFATSESSFEDLIARLKRTSANPDVGVRPMDASQVGYVKADGITPVGKTNPTRIGLEGALRTPKTVSTDYPANGVPDDFQKDVSELLALYSEKIEGSSVYGNAKLDGDPILTIPLYGQAYTKSLQGRIPSPGLSDGNWYSAINYDPRNRVAAGLGVKAIQKDQEELIQSAWFQLEVLQKARNNFAAVGTIMARLSAQMALLPSVDFVAMARNMTSKVKADAGTQTAFLQLSSSATPNALIDSASRRLMRTGGRLATRINPNAGTAISGSVLSLVNTNLNPENLGAIRAIRFDSGSLSVNSAVAVSVNPSSEQMAFEQAFEDFTKRVNLLANVPTPMVAFDFDSAKSTLIDAIKAAPLQLLKAKINLPAAPGLVNDNRVPAEIIGQPVFQNPMYEPLWQMDKEWFLPNLNLLESNTLTLLETNASFINAYMVGLNHEFGRELLWRGYPADLSATYFQKFWATNDDSSINDIEPIPDWLGTTASLRGSSGQQARLVLTLRGDLLRKFPNTVILAAQLLRNGDGKLSLDAADSVFRLPVFRAEIPPDLQFIGFDLTLSQVLDVSGDNGNKSWYFIFMEPVGEPRFGLDAAFRPNDRSNFTRNDLAWEHIGNDEFLTSAKKPTLTMVDIDQNLWGKDAAMMATFLFQQPFATLIKATELLPIPE